jgi:hypothetical protein
MAAFIVGGGFGMDFRMPSLPFMNSRPSMNSCLCFEFGNKEICFATISWTQSLLLEVAFFLPHFFCGFKSVPLLFLTEQQHGFTMVVENLFCGWMSIASLYFKGVCQQAIRNSNPTLLPLDFMLCCNLYQKLM